MPFRADTYWNNKMMSNPNIKHCYYRINEVQNIPDVPGIYSWHLWIDNVNKNKYSQIFRQKRVKIDIASNLSERFAGTIERDGQDSDIYDSSIDLDLCNIASLAMCPPLYIGISIRLGTRIGEHVDELDQIIAGTKPTPLDTLQATQFDTIYESGHFAERMGYMISKLGNFNANNLLLKTIEMPPGYTWHNLQKVEKFLNRTFIPIYGRK